MRVVIEGGDWIVRYAGAERVEVDVREGCTAMDAAAQAGIPREEIGMCLRAGRRIEPDAALGAGDAIKVLPPILGG